jgi:predicted enzyme related to lactoylglutathione lyase
MFALPGEEAPLGGMGGMFGADDAPPHWLVYFAVPDAGAAVAAAEQHGGRVLVRDRSTPYGVMAGLTDPAGAMFWVVQPPEGMPRPDRES